MKPLQLLLLVLIITSISCTDSNNNASNSGKTPSNHTTVDSLKKRDTLATTITSEVDSKFEMFIEYFNKDSLFQISRIAFPLKVQELNDDFELTERIIPKSDFRKMNFSYDKTKANKLVDTYEQKIKVKGNKAVIEIRGIENGITADYYFENRNGKWFLTTWTDSST